jgi:endonuclease/exonuclease/phosphatase family metal-dependent hydrolase
MTFSKAIRKTATITGFGALVASLALHLVVLFCLFRSWDAVAAVTVFPVWVWAIFGLACAGAGFLLTGSKLAYVPALIWFLTAFFGADERRSLIRGISPTLHGERDKPAKAAPGSDRVLRVVTINCKERNVDAVREVTRFNPDIVFVQEAPHSKALRDLATEMWGKEGSVMGATFCAVLARGKLTRRPNVLFKHGTLAMLTLPDGREIELMSVHLAHAVTRVDLWNPATWRAHTERHRERRGQLDKLLTEFEKNGPDRPTLWGGDFNAPPTSNLFDSIPDHYVNAFGTAGKGLGNTFINGFPLLRIDHIYAGPGFEIIDARSAHSGHSDHRMVIADVLLKAPAPNSRPSP